MSRYEYKIVPAPNRGLKGKGIKGPEARFANALEGKMNELAAEGWEYQRAETLPSVERSGLASTTTEWRNVLVFRRLRDNDAEAATPELLPPPVAQEEPEKAADEKPEEKAETKTAKPAKDAQDTANKDKPKSAAKSDDTPADEGNDPVDNGVEDTGDISVISSSLGKLAEARKLSKSDS